MRAATVSNAVHGFEASGLFPIDPQKSPETAFLPSEVHSCTDGAQDITPITGNAADHPTTSSNLHKDEGRNATTIASLDEPETSHLSNNSGSNVRTITAQELSPTPQKLAQKIVRKKLQVRSLITSPEYILEMKKKSQDTTTSRKRSANNKRESESIKEKCRRKLRLNKEQSSNESKFQDVQRPSEDHCGVCNE